MAYTYKYPRPEVTGDCIVITKEENPKILLIQRGDNPYKGCWAFPGGFMEMDETTEQCAIRELKEETGLDFCPLQVDEIYSRPYFTTIGLTDESCATVYGYASGTVSNKGEEASEEIEVVLADRQEVRRILKEENTAIICAYMLMHFLADEEPFGFLNLRNN